MKILIAGSNGMVGSAVTHHLTECGHEVVRLVRHTPDPGEIWWNPDAGEIDSACLEGFDGVVQLASMPWPMRWTGKAKQKIRANRLATNRLLAESLAGCEHKPKVLICASGMGYYPSSGDDAADRRQPRRNEFSCQPSKGRRDSHRSGKRSRDPGGAPAHPAGPGRQRLAASGSSGWRWATVDELGRT